MLLAACITYENQPADQAFIRYGTRSSVISAREGVARNGHTLLLNEQHFVDHNADLQSEFEERAGTDSYLKSWSLQTRHGGIRSLIC